MGIKITILMVFSLGQIELHNDIDPGEKQLFLNRE